MFFGKRKRNKSNFENLFAKYALFSIKFILVEESLTLIRPCNGVKVASNIKFMTKDVHYTTVSYSLYFILYIVSAYSIKVL